MALLSKAGTQCASCQQGSAREEHPLSKRHKASISSFSQLRTVLLGCGGSEVREYLLWETCRGTLLSSTRKKVFNGLRPYTSH